MNRKPTPLLLFFMLLCLSTVCRAQNFKLYFANNISDVKDFSKIEESTTLEWREVQPHGDVYTNTAEVNSIMRMFDSPEMKNLTHQKSFWKMRDHSLLCFRINDGSGQSGVYHVEVNYGYDHKGEPVTLSLTTSNYFFTNVPLQEQETTVKVWRANDPDNFYQQIGRAHV